MPQRVLFIGENDEGNYCTLVQYGAFYSYEPNFE